MGGRLGRWLAFGLIAVASLVSIVLLAAHTPWARARAFAWATDLASGYQLSLKAGGLGYNALTRRVTLTDVRLAAIGHEDVPFLAARRIEVKLPWTVYRGRFAMEHLDVESGVVDIRRDASGATNLPPGSKGSTPENVRRLDLRGLTVKPLDLHYVDLQHDFELTVPGIDTELSKGALGAEGSFAVRGQMALRLKTRTMTLAPIEARMTFDGSSVALNQARLAASELNVVLDGTIHRVLDATSFELALKGIVNLEPATEWAPPPVPVTGVVNITGTIAGPFTLPVLDLHVEGNDLSIGDERNISLDGPVRVTMETFSGEGMLVKPATGGEIRAAFNVPWGTEPPSMARAAWKELEAQSAFRLGDFEPQRIGAAIEGNGTFEFGDIRRYEISNRSKGRASRGFVPITGEMYATLVGDDWTIEHSHQLPGLVFEGKTSGRINQAEMAATTLAGPAHARVTDVAAAAASATTLGIDVPAIASEIHGALDAPMTLAGSFRDPKVDITVSGEALDVPLVGTVKASAHVVSDRRMAAMSAITAQHGSAKVKGDIAADITKRAWSGTLNVEVPETSQFQAGIPPDWRVNGAMTATATLGGTFDRFHLDTAITGSAFTWAGESFDGVTASAIVTAEAVDVTSMRIDQGAGQLTGRVRYNWDTAAYDTDVNGANLTYRTSLFAENDTLATFGVQFKGAGAVAQPAGNGRVDFAITGGTAGALIGAGDLVVDLQGDHALYQATLPSLGALVNGTVATSSPYEYRAVAALNQVDLQPFATLAGSEQGSVRGHVSGSALASGRLADSLDRRAFVNLQNLDATVGAIPIALAAPARWSLRDDDITLDDLNLSVGSGLLAATGEWTTRRDGKLQGHFTGAVQDVVRMGRAFGLPVSVDGTGALSVDFTSTGDRAGTNASIALKNGSLTWGDSPPIVRDLTFTADLKGEELIVSRLTGRVATVAATGDLSATARATVPAFAIDAVTGSLTVDAARFTLAGIPVSQARPSRVELAKGRVFVADATWLVAENPLTFGGSVDLGGAESPALDLSVKGVLDLRVLSAFTTSVAYDGSANLDARLEGTVASPQLGGLITLDGAEVATSDPRMLLSDLSGSFKLAGQQVIVEDVRGSANGGTITVSGPVDVSGMTIAGGTLSVQAEGVAMEFPAGFRSQVDALVTVNPSLKSPSVTGDIRASEGSYRETITLASFARRSTTPVVSTGEISYVDRMRVNVSVTTTSDASIDNNYGRLEAGAALRVVGTVAGPGMNGRITLREGGEVYLAGRTFRLTRGDISFTDLRRIRPEFNIAAESQVGGVGTVTMTLTGTVEHPTFDLTSEDGSKTPGELATALVGGGTTGTAALAVLSGDLLGVTGRAIGLDAFRLDRGVVSDSAFREDPSLIANEADPSTRLTIAKRVSDQVEVTLSQNLRESGKATVIISYFPKPSVEVRALSNDDATLGLGIRHRVTLGGGGSVAAVRAARPVVAAIDFAGASTEVERESRLQLKLHVGDRFAFLDLQKDIDRLRSTWHERGYFEARVRTRRDVSEDGKSITLEYRVERGPRTTLEIRGLDLPASERLALEAAWTSSVFDEFLIDDLTNRIRRYLLNQGEIVSVVVGAVNRVDDTKRLRIEVTPGAPVSSREIRFTGNAAFDSFRLKNAVTAAGLEREAWLDPALLERALKAIYAEAGFLRAQVIAEPLSIDGTVGVLPVRIVEGPQAKVAGITWNGVQESRQAMAVEMAKLDIGAPFQASKVDDARKRVEDRFRADGFNDVSIEIRPEPRDDSSVLLIFDVTEGPQQVLQDVQTVGAEVTRGDVIAEALRFELGTPVNLDDWAMARKRLYDTNVFRQVDVEPVPIGQAENGVQPVKAQVTVREFPRWSLRYGGQIEGERTATIGEFATSKNLGLVGEIKNPNLFGRALTFGVFGQYAYDIRDSTMLLSTSRLFGWRARSSIYAFRTRERIRDDAGDQIVAITDRSDVSAEQRWKLRGAQVVYGYRFEHNRTFDPEPAAGDPFPLDFVANIARLSAATLFDRRDNPLDPHQGTFTSASWDQGSPSLGSDVNNRKLFMQQFAFVPIGRRVVFASRAQSGMVFGPDELLPSDRFRAGGATTVRGYGEDALGPRDAIGVPKGGETLVVFNEELRFPIYRWMHGVTFVDAGNITGKGEPFAWSDLKLGYGAGFRFYTPVGLLRVDFGIPGTLLPSPTAREANSLKGGRWYFGFGNIF